MVLFNSYYLTILSTFYSTILSSVCFNFKWHARFCFGCSGFFFFCFAFYQTVFTNCLFICAKIFCNFLYTFLFAFNLTYSFVGVLILNLCSLCLFFFCFRRVFIAKRLNVHQWWWYVLSTNNGYLFLFYVEFDYIRIHQFIFFLKQYYDTFGYHLNRFTAVWCSITWTVANPPRIPIERIVSTAPKKTTQFLGNEER